MVTVEQPSLAPSTRRRNGVNMPAPQRPLGTLRQTESPANAVDYPVAPLARAFFIAYARRHDGEGLVVAALAALGVVRPAPLR